MNILWFGKTGEANAWYHITLTTAAHIVDRVYVVRHKRPSRPIESDKVLFFETGTSRSFAVSVARLWRTAHRVLGGNDTDAIITFNVFPYGFVACLLASLHRKKLILCFIGTDYNHYFQKQPYRTLVNWALKRADVVICKGRYMTPGLVQAGLDEAKIGYYPHFVSRRFFVDADSEDLCYDVINVCDFAPLKRLDVLIRALKVLKEQGVRLRACLVGDGPGKQAIIELCEELGVRSQVTFTGFQNDVLKYLRRSKYFVQTSEREALSLSLVESIAAGLVPICTEAGAEGDIIRNDVNGLFTRIGDHQDLAQRLTYAVRPDVYERLRKNVMATRESLTIERAEMEMTRVLRGPETKAKNSVEVGS